MEEHIEKKEKSKDILKKEVINMKRERKRKRRRREVRKKPS